jgi:hypothetical protein
MSFVHDTEDFDDLLAIVAQKHHLTRGLVEKDYGVTHTLGALHQSGLDIGFRGGTSRSKGFGLIERFGQKQLAALIDAGDPVFALAEGARTPAIRAALARGVVDIDGILSLARAAARGTA